MTRLFAKSRDYDVLLKAWIGWRDASGGKMKDLFEEFVGLSNEAIAILGDISVSNVSFVLGILFVVRIQISL